MANQEIQSWTILNNTGEDFVEFSSLISFSLSNEGQISTNPVEEGGFISYNKVSSPRKIFITLAMQGDNHQFETALKTLDEFKTKAIKVDTVTPSEVYASISLESYNYTREIENGAGMLVVELIFVEVREVKTNVTTKVIASPKNPTSSSTVNKGQVQPKENRSLGARAMDGIKNSISTL